MTLDTDLFIRDDILPSYGVSVSDVVRVALRDLKITNHIKSECVCVCVCNEAFTDDFSDGAGNGGIEVLRTAAMPP